MYGSCAFNLPKDKLRWAEVNQQEHCVLLQPSGHDFFVFARENKFYYYRD